MTVGEIKRRLKDVPDYVTVFRVTGDHEAYEINTVTDTFVEKFGPNTYEYFSDFDMEIGSVKERAIVVR